jgi:hypothetical protein
MRLANGVEIKFLDEPEGRFICIADLIVGIERAEKTMMEKPFNTWVQKTTKGFIDNLKLIRDVK